MSKEISKYISFELRHELHHVVYKAVMMKWDEEELREALYEECRKSCYKQPAAKELAIVIQAFVDFWER